MSREINYKDKIDINKPAICKGCGAKIYWIKTDNLRKMPIDPDGIPHFATCPNAAKFRVNKK